MENECEHFQAIKTWEWAAENFLFCGVVQIFHILNCFILHGMSY